MDCPEENVLVDFVRGDLDDEGRNGIETHIDSCELCSAVLVELARFEPASEELAVTDQSFVPEPVEPTPQRKDKAKIAPRLAEGDKLGRYVILQKVGAGGMGVVYAAYDPELDRKIAIKLLMTSLGKSMAAEFLEQRARLLREAQAMAKLSHPNVITVHDVGEFGEQIFLAMEFVDGENLKQWSRADRSWREVLSVYTAAGRGLAAAHRADLVHRDFKPDNVLIDDAGGVFVTDFGLARPAAGKTDSFNSVRTLESIPVMSAQLTRTGALVGTPAFMAPEQLAGERSGALADQFSFCVALYDALYGTRPFEGRVLGELMANVSAGRIKTPPRDADVPRKIRRALFRGLSVRPEDRYPTMEALLADLSSDPAKHWRRWAAVVLPSTVLGVGLVAFANGPSSGSAYCDNVSSQLAGVWDGTRAEDIERAFGATEKPYATAVWSGVERSLEAYAATWIEAQESACAAEADSAHPQALVALRMSCLQRQRETLGTLTEVLTEVDATSLERARDAVALLPHPSQCEDSDTLARRYSDLDTPQQRSQREALEGKVRRAEILRDTGKLDEAEREALAALEVARAQSDRWSEADALATLGDIDDLRGRASASETRLHEAMSAALASDNRVAVSRVAVGLLWLSTDPGRPIRDAERWYAHGLASLEQQGTQPAREIQFENAVASAYMAHNNFEQAEAHMQRALEIRRDALGDDHASASTTWTNLGQLYAAQGKMPDAIDAFERALALSESRYGTLHPFVAGPLENLGAAWGQQRKYEKARDYLQRGLDIRRLALGPHHPHNSNGLLNLANVDRHLGDYRAAEAKLVEAHNIAQVTDPGSVNEAEMLLRLGRVQRTLGKLAAAEQSHAQAVKLVENIGEFPPLERARFLAELGRSRVALGDYEGARPWLAKAKRDTEALEATDIDRAMTVLWWASGFESGVPAASRAAVEAAAKVAAENPRALRGCDALQTMAEVAWANGDLDQARELAGRAQARLSALGREGELPLERSRRWLEAHQPG